MFQIRRTALIPLALGGLMACASVQPPQQQQAASASAIRAAEEIGANDIPQAALHLQLAREQVAEAEKLMGHKRYEQANALLRRAEIDAELALSLAHARPLQEQALEALEALEQVKKQGR